MGRRNREDKLKNKKTRRNLKTKILGVLLPLIIVIGILAGLAVSSYQNWSPPLIPKVVLRASDITIASVSFLPKTPKQILTKAVYETGRVKSGVHNFSLLVKQKTGENEERIVMSPEISGPFIKSENQIDIAGTIFLGFPSESEDSKSEVKFVEQDEYLYFKASNTPSLQNINLNKLGSDWYRIDMPKVISDARTNVRKDEEIEKTINEKLELLFDTLVSEKILEKFDIFPNEDITGRESYHYKINVDDDLLKKITEIFFSEDDRFKNVEDITLDLWVDKSDFYFSKMEISGQLTNDPISPSPNVVLQEQGLDFTLVYELHDAGADVEIEVPENAKEVDSLLGLYLLVQDEKAEDDPSVILGAVSSLGEFGANFLTIERLLHVLYLAPQSF